MAGSVLEICVDSLESAIAAQTGGAQRIELCAALAEGGLTPSLGLLRAVRARVSMGVNVMIRPRGGDFLYSEDEVAIMRTDIALAAEAGADGVVLGLLTEYGDVDRERTRALIELARPMEVTFHRALDMTRDPQAALEDIILAGADRVLTSGAEPTAQLGRHRIQALVRAGGDRIKVMAGGGVRPGNVQQIARESGVCEFHAALRHATPSPVQHQVRTMHLGSAASEEYVRYIVRPEDVRSLQQAMLACGEPASLVVG